MSLSSKNRNQNIDSGWAWCVVFAIFLSNALIGGFDRAIGIIYEEQLSQFDSTSAATAGLTSILFGLKFMLGPIAGALAGHFTARNVVYVGTFCTFLGLVLSAFATNFQMLYFTFGFLLGFGNGLCYTPCIIAISQYFSRRLATALGLSYAGTGLGSFLMPLLVTHLVEGFAVSGALLVMAAVQLHLAVSAALIRPLAKEETEKEEIQLKKVKEENEEEIRMKKFKEEDEIEEDARQPLRGGEQHKKQSRFRSLPSRIARSFHLSLFTSPRFLLPGLGALLITGGFKSVPLLLTHHATLCGLSRSQAALLLSLSGISDTVTRVITGIFFDLRFVRRIRRALWNVILFLLATVVVLIGISAQFWVLVVLSCAFGATSGVFVCQLVGVLVDLVGQERSAAAIGFLHLLRGIGALFGPAVAGHLKDKTEGYLASFAFLGVTIAVGGLLFVPTLCLSSKDAEEEEEEDIT